MKKNICILLLLIYSSIHLSPFDFDKNKTIIISCSKSIPPFCFVNEKNKPEGVLIDYWRLWADKTGYKVEFRLTNWYESLMLVKNGEADIHAGLLYSDNRSEFLDYTSDIVPLSAVVFTLNDLNINSMSDLGNFEVAAVKGGFEEEFLNKNYPGIQSTSFENYENMVKQCVKGNYKAFVADYPVGMYFLQKYGEISQYKVLKKLYTFPMQGAVKKGDKTFIKMINEGIAAISQEEEDLLFQKWIRSEEVLPYWVVPGLTILILVFLSVSLFFYTYVLRLQVKRKTADLSAAQQSIKESVVRRQLFYRQLAHEIKTPLTPIIHCLDRHIQTTGIDEDLKIVKANFDRLINTTIDFLDIEKISVGSDCYNHNQVVDITGFIRNKLQMFHGLMLKKDITPSYTQTGEIFVNIDPLALDVILNNLISNAIKYSQEKVYINVENKEKNILIQVKNDGKPVSGKHQKHLFEPFCNFNSRKAGNHSHGLGLYKIKQIIEISLGGKITYNSGIMKTGTDSAGFTNVFQVELEEYLPDEKTVISSSVPEKVNIIHADIELPEKIIHDDGKKNIFILEDDIYNLYIIYCFFKNDFNVYYGYNGKDALEKLQSAPLPDVFISDVMMDEMDGIAFFEKLMEQEEYNDIPFIFLTAKTYNDKALKMLNEGAMDYLSKPYPMQKLREKIEKYINIRDEKTKKLEETVLEKSESGTGLTWEEKIDLVLGEYTLGKRPKEVACLRLCGKTEKDIAKELFISIDAVKKNMTRVFAAMEITTVINGRRKLDILKNIINRDY